MSNGTIDPEKGKKKTPSKSKASSYDDKFLDSLANTNAYKQWASDKTKLRAATTNAFDSEAHRVAFDSSNEDELDEGVNPFLNQFVDLNAEDPYEELRAASQSGWEQAGKIIPRAATKALAEVAKIPGVVGGLAAAPFAKEGEGYDTAFNNAWIKTVDELQGKINEDLMPIYTAKAVKEGNLWDNITSTSFWATDGADGIGFIAGMMAPGAAFEYLSLGSKLVKGISNSEKLAKWTKMVGKAEEGTKFLKAIGASGKNIDSGLAVMGNTLLEAGAEAKGAGDRLEENKGQFIAQHTSKKMLQLNQAREAGLIGEDEYNQAAEQVNLEAEESFKEQKALAMRNTFVTNVGILLGPNAMMHKAIWGKAAQKFERSAEAGLKGVAKRVGKAGERALKTTLSEGYWEEGSQTTAENLFVNKAMKGELGKKSDKSFYEQAKEGIGEFTDEYANTLASTEGQKAIFLGAVLGTPMTSYQGRKQDVANRERTNTILDNIDKQITHFNDTFDTDIYKKDDKGEFVYEKDADGNLTTNRKINNKKVREIAKSLNFSEEQSALFDLAVKTGNKKVVNKLKEQAIFNLILPAVHNGEAGIEALERKLAEDSKFNEIVERDLTADEKDKSKAFIKETLESAKWLQAQKERFTDFSNDVIQLSDEEEGGRFKEEFLEKLSASYLNSKYALRTAEKELKELEKKRSNAFNEAGADESYGLDPEFPTASMKPGLVTNEDLDKRAAKTKEFLESNELIQNIDKEYQAKKAEIAAHKKDISDIWKGPEKINKAYQKFSKKQAKEEKDSSDEAVAEADDLINGIEGAQSRDELNQLLLPPHIRKKTNQEYDREAVDAVIKDARKRLRENNSTENLKSIIEKLQSLDVYSGEIDDLIEGIESILEDRLDKQESFRGELDALFERHSRAAKEHQDTIDEHQKKLNELLAKQKFLQDELAKETKSPRGRYAKLMKELIADTQRELDKVNKEIKEQERLLESQKKEQKEYQEELNYIFERYNQVNKTEFENINDIVDYLIKNSSRFKEHRNDLEVLLIKKFGTERRIEEINDTVDYLEKYKDTLESVLEQYASMLDSVKKPGTDMAEYKYLRDELIKTSKQLFEAKQDLKENEEKLQRLSKAVIDKSALQSLNKELDFWNNIQDFKEKRVNPLAKNPVIAQKVAEKLEEIEENETIEEEVEAEIHQNVEDDAKVNKPEEVPDVVAPEVSTDEEGNYTSESIPEVEDEEYEDPVDNSENITDAIAEELDGPQGGTKVISTNMYTGKALHPSLEPFIEYERTPRDKTNDKVTFSVGDIKDKKGKEAYDNVLKGTASREEIALLETSLPIKVEIEYVENGKTKKVFSYIEGLTKAIKEDPDSLEMFENETLPLRKNIVDNLVTNQSFEGISTNIVRQYPGLLTVDKVGQKTYEDQNGVERVSKVPKNNIFDLQVFDGMTKEEKIEYFQKNTAFVNWEGRLMSTINTRKQIGPLMSQLSKGEIFLRIPQNDGSPFWLKLNVNKISDKKAEAIYEMVAALSAVSQTVGKKSTFGAMTVDQFFSNLDVSDPDTSTKLKKILKREIALVKQFNKGDKRNESLSRFLDLILYHKSKNLRTGFRLNKDGSLNLGSLAAQLMDNEAFEHGLTITKREMQTPEAKKVITRYVQYKRHNILVTRDGAEQFVFENPAYVEYLLDGLLSTNAVVKQPTFQGYSNIYLNQQVTNSKPSAKKAESKDVINDVQWSAFVDNNHVDSGILSSIAYKIKDGKSLTPRETAILQARTAEIEDLLSIMKKEVIAEPSVDKKAEIEKNRAEEIARESRKESMTEFKTFEFSFEKKNQYGGGSFSTNITIETTPSRISKGKLVKKAGISGNSYANLPHALYLFDKEYPEETSDESIIEEVLNLFRSNEVIEGVRDGVKQTSRYSYPETIAKINAKYDAQLAALEPKKTKTKKEVVVKTNEAGEDLNMKKKFAEALAKKKNPNSKEDVKTDVNEMKEIFNKGSEDTKADMIVSLAEEFGTLDAIIADEKALEPENLNKTFDKLLSIAKQKNKSIDDLKKICGI